MKENIWSGKTTEQLNHTLQTLLQTSTPSHDIDDIIEELERRRKEKVNKK